MNTFARFLFVLFAGASLTASFAQETNSVLHQVEARLQPVLADLTPAPTFEYPKHSRSLLVYYRPQKFFVHGRTMTGEWLTNVFEEIGPSSTGFVLRVHAQPLGEINQAATPQTLQEPYWRTYLNVTPVAGTTNQLFWSLSSAGRTDKELLAKLSQAVESLAGSPRKSAER